MKASNDVIFWNRCVFCGEEIYSKTYKPLFVNVSGIAEDEGSKVVLMGYSHKSCGKHFNLELSKLIEKMAFVSEVEKGIKQ
jgi:hypothetical protein